MSYKLWYFKFRGRGEPIRLLLEALGQPYENAFIDREGFVALQKEGPAKLAFGSVPALQDGDFWLIQGPVIMGYLARAHGAIPGDARQAARADAITLGAEDLRVAYFKLFRDDAEGSKEDKQEKFLAGPWAERWLPRLDGLLALNNSDRAFVGQDLGHADVAVWDILNAFQTYIPGASLNGHARLEAFYRNFAERPAIAAYLASSRRLP